MNLKTLFIKSYGPLHDLQLKFKPGINLVFGPNEKGKSLTLDTMVKLLTGKRSRQFEHIDRVPDQPEKTGSYLELALRSQQTTSSSQLSLDEANSLTQKTVKLQGQPEISQLLGLTAAELQNVFIIRNSNLSIGQDLEQEEQFYTSLTDKLTGLKTEQINALIQILLDMAELTDKTHQFKSTQDNQQLGERLEKAQQLLSKQGKLANLIKDADQTGWQRLLETQASLQSELNQLLKQTEKLEIARKRERYQKLNQALTKLTTAEQKLSEFKHVSQKSLTDWRDQQNNIQRLAEIQQEIEDEVKQVQQQLKQAQTRQIQLEQSQPQHVHLQQLLESQSLPQLEQLADLKSELAGREQTQTYWKIGLAVGSGLLVISALNLFNLNSEIGWGTGIIGLMTVLTGMFQLGKFYQQRAKYQQQLEAARLKLVEMSRGDTDLNTNESNEHPPEQNQAASQSNSSSSNDSELGKIDLSQLKTGAPQLETLISLTQQLKQYHRDQQTQLQVQKMEVRQIKQQLETLKQRRLANVKEKIQQSQTEIKKIKLQAKSDTLEEFQQKLAKKQQLETVISTNQTLLKNELETKGYSPQTNRRYWQEEINKLEVFKNKATEVEFDEKQWEQAQQTRKNVETQLRQARADNQQLQQELKQLENRLNQILLDPEEPIVCQSVADLVHAQNRLTTFVDQAESQKQLCLQTISLLEEIQKIEKKKVAALFGQNSHISQQFETITQNRYQQVFFDPDNNQIKVEAQDESVLEPWQLSAGTYDQLYFAIRLGLAQELLTAEPGFFLMDDPFLKADQTRLTQQLDMLKQIGGQGWQIIFFSAKDEILAGLKQVEPKLNLIKLP